ncbi:Inner membrane protein YecN [Thalassocella blandensis]|nr:Inner membrane protein YecN [Thalassocella blandensis]
MISAFYAALLAILVIALAFRVSKNRIKYRVGIGAGDNKDLDLVIRCHANAVEIVPLAVLMLVLAELQGLHAIALHVAGLVLLVTRIMHPIGLTKAQGGPAVGRFYGTIGSWLTVVLLAIANLALYILSVI